PRLFLRAPEQRNHRRLLTFRWIFRDLLLGPRAVLRREGDFLRLKMRIGEAARRPRFSPNSLWDLAGKRHDEAAFDARAFAILGHSEQDEFAVLAEQQVQTARLEGCLDYLVSLRKKRARPHARRGWRLRVDPGDDFDRRPRFFDVDAGI